MVIQNNYDDPLWYKDAIIYELHIKSFYDSNNDGIGDIRGVTEKLNYLENLGVTAIWLLPFYPSPLRDDGYDIADYRNINQQYGSLQDLKQLLREAHKKGIRVITELVLNHTSDQHWWFQRARRAKPGTSHRNFFVWSNTTKKYQDARIIFSDFENSNWTWDSEAKAYYWHRFYYHQPDLNFDNPRVQKEMFRAIDFWLGTGVDGLRLDAVPYLYEREGTNCENLPETHEFLKKLRKHIDSKFKNKMLLSEANQWAEDAMQYFGNGDESHMAFNFPVMPRMFMAVQMEDRFPLIDIMDPPLDIPENCQWCIFLRNHDELTLEMVTDEERDYMYRVYAEDPRAKINLGIRRRLAPLLQNDRKKIELLNILLFSLPGTPVIYYGDEIGMGDNFYLGDRDGVRTPMQWSSDRNAGFSKANPQKLYLPVIIDPEYNYETINVETQDKNLSSLLWWMRRVIGMRKKYKAFSRGSIEFLNPGNNKVLAFLREYNGETILVVVNLSRFSQVVELNLDDYEGHVPEEMFSKNDFPMIRDYPYILTLGPHNHFWLLLRKEEEIEEEQPEEQILLKVNTFNEIFNKEPREQLEQEILPEYLLKARWFGGKGRKIRDIKIIERGRFTRPPMNVNMLILQVNYFEGLPELYFLPAAFKPYHDASRIMERYERAQIIHAEIGGDKGIIYDALYDTDFHQLLLEMLTKRKKAKGKKGDFTAVSGRNTKNILNQLDSPPDSELLNVEQSNTSILYDDTLIIKMFRKLDNGINPDVEIEQYLTDKAGYPQIPTYAGTLEYKKEKEDNISIALLQDYVPNEGVSWTFVMDHLGMFLENLLTRKEELKDVEIEPVSLTDGDGSEKNKVLEELVDGFFTEMIELLGKRTGEMHLALASSRAAEFKPEAFSTLYQRSVFQSMKNLQRQSFRLLRNNMNKFSDEIVKEAEEVMQAKDEIINRLKRITEKKFTAKKIRIHGDYHLGQVLFTGKDFVIIDFEGEPARPLSERKLKRSPLRDAAGMVRSFHYAAYSGLFNFPSIRSEDVEFLEPWMKVWYYYISRIFMNSYLKTVEDAAFLPNKKEDLLVMYDAFLMEKAIYELGYELNNRPDWVKIPLRGIKFIL